MHWASQAWKSSHSSTTAMQLESKSLLKFSQYKTSISLNAGSQIFLEIQAMCALVYIIFGHLSHSLT